MLPLRLSGIKMTGCLFGIWLIRSWIKDVFSIGLVGLLFGGSQSLPLILRFIASSPGLGIAPRNTADDHSASSQGTRAPRCRAWVHTVTAHDQGSRHHKSVWSRGDTMFNMYKIKIFENSSNSHRSKMKDIWYRFSQVWPPSQDSVWNHQYQIEKLDVTLLKYQ